MADSITSIVGTILDSGFIKALLALSTVAVAASPVMRFFHDRSEKKLRLREVAAQEIIARAAMITAKAAMQRRKP